MATAGNPYQLPGPTGATGTAQPGTLPPWMTVGASGPTGPSAGANGLADALTGAPATAQGNNSYSWSGPETFYGNTPAANHIGQQAQAQISPDILNSMQGYTDAAYQQQLRQLDPQWQQRQAAFGQQMVGQGLQPGSAAYDNAMRDFTASQNDAYSQARLSSMQAGLGAQNQAFGQGLANATLTNNRDIAGIGANAQRSSAAMGAHASMYNNDNNNATTQLLGLGNLGLGYQGQQDARDQNDFENMLAAFGFGNSQDMYNNEQTSGAAQNLMGQIPHGGPALIDVTGPYGMQASGQQAQYGAQQQAYQGRQQAQQAAASTAIMAAVML